MALTRLFLFGALALAPLAQAKSKGSKKSTTTTSATTTTTSATATTDTGVPTTDICESYGVDFQPGGTYFQNESSTDPFTFVSIFQDCQVDICQNLLVAPDATEYECTNTNLTPADTNQLSSCDIDKDQMTSGEWTIVLNSNNGNGDPVAYQREFSLIVGYPTTYTITPTVTATVKTSAVVNVTTTLTTDVVVHTNTTITDPAVTVAPTVTVHPSTTTTITTTMATISKTAHTVSPVLVTETYTALCTIPPAQQYPDPWLTFTPTMYEIPALQTPHAYVRGAQWKERGFDVKAYIAARKERLAKAHNKRDIDYASTTVTCTDTALYPTTTTTITTSTSTLLVTTMVTDTTTSTTTYTTHAGTTTYPTDTVTAPTTTITKHKYTVVTTVVATVTLSPTITVWATTTPYQPAKICTDKGGIMW